MTWISSEWRIHTRGQPEHLTINGKGGAVLKPGAYTKQEIVDAVGVPEHELDAACLSANTLDMKEFRLHDRAMHVFSGE